MCPAPMICAPRSHVQGCTAVSDFAETFKAITTMRNNH
ncbi:hypothetical protein A2U01_0099038, partial [Trifolium medium]|nr:hypothetical protein [Trifolium medium]